MKAFLRSVNLEVKAYDPSDPLPLKIADVRDPDRVKRFVASDDTVDRYGDVVYPKGWTLANYVKNPVVMQHHDHASWPIGIAIAGGVVGNKLVLDVDFDPPEVDEAADLAFRKIDYGTVKAGSVGFMGLESIRPQDDGAEPYFQLYPEARRIFTRSELLEFTICAIPANPNALAASFKSRHGVEIEDRPESDGVRFCDYAVLRRVERMAKQFGAIAE